MKSLHDLIHQAAKTESLSEEIDTVTQKILAEAGTENKIGVLKQWLAKRQPCLFGRLAATDENQLGIGICWIEEDDIAQGDEYVRIKIQEERRQWKNKAAQGFSHGFLLMFSGWQSSHIAPGSDLTAVGQRMAELFMPEVGIIKTDVIYTEAIPLRYPDGLLRLHKGGVNMFYSTAHGTLNHDRRMPGGILFSVNGPGHFAQSLVLRGLQKSMDDAIRFVYSLTVRSIGNGSIGSDEMVDGSCTWHKHSNSIIHSDDPIISLGKKLPPHVPDDFNRESFSGNYHTDILIPKLITENKTLKNTNYKWNSIYFDYFSNDLLPYYHPSFGWWIGMPVPDEAIYFNPWHPERPIDGDWRDSPFWSQMCRLHSDILL